MSDQEIMDLYNDTLRAQAELVAMTPYVATEIPLNSPQIEFSKWCSSWSLRGHVLRCGVDDGGEDGEPVVTVDGKELSWHEFGKMIVSFAGWGMRIEFTPEDEIHRRPKLEVKQPEPD
jgi:hypothetical protein